MSCPYARSICNILPSELNGRIPKAILSTVEVSPVRPCPLNADFSSGLKFEQRAN